MLSLQMKGGIHQFHSGSLWLGFSVLEANFLCLRCLGCFAIWLRICCLVAARFLGKSYKEARKCLLFVYVALWEERNR